MIQLELFLNIHFMIDDLIIINLIKVDLYT